MFYIKTKLEDGRIIRSGIQDNNTYTLCEKCDKEFPVRLDEVFSSKNDDPFNANIVCPECNKKLLTKQKPTMDDIVLLTTALCKLGHINHVLCLYEDFEIDSIQELSEQDYNVYIDALLSSVAGGR